MLDTFIAPYDATVSQKLNQVNLVMLGKTNMDEFAMGSSNENSFYNAVKTRGIIQKYQVVHQVVQQLVLRAD